MKPVVKICGLKRARDAELAVSLGAGFVGAVRTRSSPRRVSVEEARVLFSEIGSRAERVLVFRDCALDEVLKDARAADASWVQLYEASDEDVLRVEAEGFRVLRVYTVGEKTTELPPFRSQPSFDRPALFDVGGGGTGRRFDWSLLGASAPPFTFVAGGINPENVSELLDQSPFGIDLSSGVEREPGVKDEGKLKRLFERVQGKGP
jgi:phosphoribosylanthranilate isomerase